MLIVVPVHDVHVTVIVPDDAPMLAVAVPLTAPLLEVLVAVIVAVPVLDVVAVTRPLLLTFTTVGSELVHVEEPVRFWVLPSLNVPVAVNCWVCPTLCNENVVGVTAKLVKVGSTKKPLQPAPTANSNRVATAATS